ncbi:MAG: hypothetical protein J6A59_01820 [Lachnospiraceae bacterium]|nr:hypothetical protein [Lachnospiraceae bacterium]
MEWLDVNNKETRNLIRFYLLIHVLMLIAIVLVAVKLAEIADILQHFLYHAYNCCEFH